MANEQKKARRFNLFDAVVIVVILVLIIGVYFVIHRGSGSSTANTTAVYTVELTNLPEGTESLITVGEHFKENTKNYDAGTVVSVEVLPYTVDVTNEDTGSVSMAEVPDRETLLVTLEVDAIDTDTSLTSSDGMTLRVGESASISNDNMTGSGYIVHIER